MAFVFTSCAFAQGTQVIPDTNKAVYTSVTSVTDTIDAGTLIVAESATEPNSVFMVYLLAIAGVLIHLFVKYYDSYTKKETFDFKGHGLLAIVSAVFVSILIYCFDFIPKEFITFAVLNPFTAFLLGYMSDSLLKNISNFTGKK